MKIRCQVCNKEVELREEEIIAKRILTLCPHRGPINKDSDLKR